MSTTPVPTAASAHLAMVEALRHLVDSCDRGADVEVMGRALARCRAALEGWEKREPLRGQPELHGALATLLDYHRGAWTEDDRSIVLDVFDGLLFGTGPRTGREQGEGGDRG